MAYTNVKEMLKDARNFASGANDTRTVSLLKDIQLEVYDLFEENRELRLENEQLKNNLIKKSQLVWKNNAYVNEDNENEIYCPKCLDDEEKFIRMQFIVELYSTHYTAKCPKCGVGGGTEIKHNQDTSIKF